MRSRIAGVLLSGVRSMDRFKLMPADKSRSRASIAVNWILAVAVVAGAAGAAHAQPSFSKVFLPDTIGPGGTSTLRFEITNNGETPASDLAFTDTLPASLVIASPANTATTCAGTLAAPSGGTTITFSDGAVAIFSSCFVSVDVTGATPGAHMNVSGPLTSSAGNSGSASATLTVATDRPGFTKVFTPSSVSRGARSTLTFTIDNTANATEVTTANFTDTLPSGMEIASPANAVTDCGSAPVTPTLTAAPGSSAIAFAYFGVGGFPAVGAGASCTVEVDVIATGAGLLGNTSSELLSTVSGDLRSSGKASAVLEVTSGTISLRKSFTNDPVPPGGTVNLQFVIDNLSRDASASNISFTDDLDATLSGLVATGLPLSNPCGAGSQLTGTGLLTLSGGNLGPGGSCTINVTLQVPTAASAGAYPNTTSAITANVGGSPFTGDPASETLFVESAPILTKEFIDDPVGAGGAVTLRFTITNSGSESITEIEFNDDLNAVIPFSLAANSLVAGNGNAEPMAGVCGAGSQLTLFDPPDIGMFVIPADPSQLIFTGGSLAPAGSAGERCTFDVVLDVDSGVPAGTYTNTTSSTTATVGMNSVTGSPASDDLVIVGAPRLTKEFTDDPVAPGGTVTLKFTLDYTGDNVVSDATDITFTDDLAAAITGLAATGLPLNDLCGSGNGTLTGTVGNTMLTFAGATLSPGDTCTFSVNLEVPDTATAGPHTNTTSTVMATVQGAAAMSPGASDDLLISGLRFTKEFTDDPVIPGGTVTLEFTLENSSPDRNATALSFTDNLANVLGGLTATGLPMADVCGTGSQLSGTTNLSFTGGNLAAGASCTFSVTLQVPAMAASGTYGNTTSNLIATIDGTPVILPPAADQLTVSGDVLLLTKTFTDDPVALGGTVTLEFTVANGDAVNSVSAIAFSDDLDAALSGLVAVGLPAADVCGAGSQISGTSLLSLTGGSLAAGASCTFSVTLQVPAMVPSGTTIRNTTSSLTGMAGGLAATGGPASDELTISFLSFSKTFESIAEAGGTVQITFHIDNLNPTAAVSTLSFFDNLDTALAGLAATGLPLNDICGTGSSITGSSILTFSGGNLPPGGSCTFSVNLAVPADAPLAGDFLNTTGELFVSGLPVADAASDTLQVRTSITNSATATASGAAPAMGQTTNTVQP